MDETDDVDCKGEANDSTKILVNEEAGVVAENAHRMLRAQEFPTFLYEYFREYYP